MVPDTGARSAAPFRALQLCVIVLLHCTSCLTGLNFVVFVSFPLGYLVVCAVWVHGIDISLVVVGSVEQLF